MQKAESIPLRSGNKTRSVHCYHIYLKHGYGSPCHGNQKKKRKRKSVKLSLQRTIPYIEHPKDSTRKLEVVNEFGKLQTTKSLAFLYTNNERSEREIRETIPFTIASKRGKYLSIDLPKETALVYKNVMLTERN